ncbi:MAG TPA: MBL fold metallo-hydrolase [Cytophagaceae bacterium]|jgi:glyoxylase-like metal-dependent hydrolase (beta-lactamase superfamily II)
MKIQTFTFNAFSENTFVLYDETKECIIIDPGCYDTFEQEELTSFIESNKLKPLGIYNTHCHVDHVLGNSFLKRKYGLKLFIHEFDKPTLETVKIYSTNYGFHKYEPASPDEYINEGDEVKFGHTTLNILFVPGHAPGHVAFLNKVENVCISGDVLFRRSVGRTDFPGCSHEALLNSIRTKLYVLPDQTVIYPGHGPTTTILEEKEYNPFCNTKVI